MKRSLKILLLEDEKTDAEIIQRLLLKEKMNCEFHLTMNKKGFITALEEFSPDIVLSDNSMPKFTASEALKIIRQLSPHIPFILVTGTVSEEFAANIIKEGADDYILKDRMNRLPAAIEAALNQRKIEKEIADYKYALDQSAIVAITDQKGIIQYANENFSNISQYTSEELIGEDHRIVNSSYHPASYIKDLWVTIANGGIWHGEFRNKRKDGSFYWVDTTIVPFLDKNGKPYQYLAIRKDISEKKKAEEDSLQTQMRLKQAQEIAHLGSWVINLETNTSKWSDEAYRIYGLNPGDHNLSIDDWMSFVHPDDMEYIKKILGDSQRTLSDIAFYHRILRKDGSIRHLYAESKFEFNNEDKPTTLYGIAHDITEMKKLEIELRDQQRQEQLKITATALEAQEKERNAIGQELHDNVNQILVGTKIMLSMIKSNPEKASEIITSAINNLQDAINENRKIAHELVAPNLKTETLANQLFNLTHDMLKVTGVDTNIDTAQLQENLLSEEQKISIYRIAQEQCTNIVKYAGASIVDIFLSTKDDAFKMIITDNGKGMEAGKQTDGIGLRNIKGRLSIYNGTADIITSPGKGFTLEILIPLI